MLYAAEVSNAIGSTIEGSSFSGLLARIEIGHIRIGSAGKGLIRSRGSGSSLSQRTWSVGARINVESPRAIALLDDGNQIVFNELARGVADQPLFLSEEGIVPNEVDAAKLDGRHGESPGYEDRI